IGKGVDNDVTFVSQLPEKIRPRAGHFPSGDELHTFVSLLKKLTDMSEKLVGIGLVIVQKTNALVAQLRYFLVASLVRLEILGAVGLTILISSLSMFVSSKNVMFALATKHNCVVRILNLRRPSRGRTFG